jgi:hypothetical protein
LAGDERGSKSSLYVKSGLADVADQLAFERYLKRSACVLASSVLDIVAVAYEAVRTRQAQRILHTLSSSSAQLVMETSWTAGNPQGSKN